MKKSLGSIGFVFLLAAVSSPAQIQFFKVVDKTVPVQIPHAPTIGLTVKRIAFGQSNGACADELINSKLMSDFQLHQIEVVDREHLRQILAEQNFSQTQQGELALGKILGPSVMIFVRVDECSPSQLPLIGSPQRAMNGQQLTTYISKTRFAIDGSIEAVNLTTGQALGNHGFSVHPERENQSTAGPPEFVPVDEVKEEAMAQAAAEVHKLFFPWTESTRLFVHDDKDCGLKQVAALIHGNDAAGAFQLAQTDLAQCKASHEKEKTLARAYYDTGLAAMMAGHYDQAKPLFTQAMQMKGADESSTALQVCNSAEIGAAAVQQYEARFAAIPAPAAYSFAAQTAAAQPPSTTQTATPAATPTPGATAKPTVEARLKKLDQLLKQGLITRKDYEAKKAQILNDL